MNDNERFGQIEAMLADLLRRMDRQAEQMNDVINILKISDERQTRAEERQDTMLVEMRRGFDEQNKRLVEQGQRTDAVLNTQVQMLELMSRQATRTDELEQRVPSIMAYETRMRRLEEAVFNKAS